MGRHDAERRTSDRREYQLDSDEAVSLGCGMVEDFVVSRFAKSCKKLNTTRQRRCHAMDILPLTLYVNASPETDGLRSSTPSATTP